MYRGLWRPTSFAYSPNPLFHTFSSSSHQYLLPSFLFSPCVLFHWEIGVIREEYPQIPWPPAQSPASICAYSLPSFLGMKHTKLCISAVCALDPIPSPLLKDSESATFPSPASSFPPSLLAHLHKLLPLWWKQLSALFLDSCSSLLSGLLLSALAPLQSVLTSTARMLLWKSKILLLLCTKPSRGFTSHWG